MGKGKLSRHLHLERPRVRDTYEHRSTFHRSRALSAWRALKPERAARACRGRAEDVTIAFTRLACLNGAVRNRSSNGSRNRGCCQANSNQEAAQCVALARDTRRPADGKSEYATRVAVATSPIGNRTQKR